jgi:hypothetical protein
MRLAIFIASALVLIGSAAVAGDPRLPTPPKKWDPKFFESTMTIAHDARNRGDRHNAERLCELALPFVDRSIGEELSNYANLLTQQNNVHGEAARANAQRYAQVQEMHAHATESQVSPLGFEPFVELSDYAFRLEQLHRQKDAASIRALTVAERRSQEAYHNRILLIQDGKDPTGEC